MIEIDFHDQAGLVRRLGDDLVGPHPSCWDVVLPPGFGEERFARQLEAALRRQPRRPLVAVQGADAANPTVADFVRALHWQWAETDRPPRPLDKSPSLYLDLLLRSFQQSERPLVLVLTRFHKVLDNLKKWVLGKLRREEQNKRLHTVIVTPLPLPTLKKRWEARKHYFSNSDYGDSRHKTVPVVPPAPADVERLGAELDLPPAVAAHAYHLTGGYPQHLEAVLEWWDNQRRPDLAPAVRAELLRLAREQLGVFLEWLDPLEDGVYRDHVIDLYHRVNPEQAREAFHSHPWREVVLDGEGLRAEALGAAALDAALRDGGDGRALQSPWNDARERARLLYDRRQFATALRVLNLVDPGRLRPHDRVLRVHARVMVELAGEEGHEHFGADTNCRRLRHALGEARDVLADFPLPLSPSDRQKIEGRYRQLEEVASAITAAGAVDGPFARRLADVLAGFASDRHRNARGAALLLLVRAEAGKAIAGDSSACQFVLVLPEQIFCVWALWALGLDYYRAPEEDDVAWRAVEREWPSVRGTVRRAAPGEKFPSFALFTFYALARWQALPPDGRMPPPEPGFKELESALTGYERVRNGQAHGMYQPTRKQREKYFELIDRWLASLLAACPDRVTREELLELTEPLPAVNANGTMSW